MTHKQDVDSTYLRGICGGKGGYASEYATPEFFGKLINKEATSRILDHSVLTELANGGTAGHVCLYVPLNVGSNKHVIGINMGSGMDGDLRMAKGIKFYDHISPPKPSFFYNPFKKKPKGFMVLKPDVKWKTHVQEMPSFFDDLFKNGCNKPLELTKDQLEEIKEGINLLSKSGEFREQKRGNCFYKHPKIAQLIVDSIISYKEHCKKAESTTEEKQKGGLKGVVFADIYINLKIEGKKARYDVAIELLNKGTGDDVSLIEKTDQIGNLNSWLEGKVKRAISNPYHSSWIMKYENFNSTEGKNNLRKFLQAWKKDISRINGNKGKYGLNESVTCINKQELDDKFQMYQDCSITSEDFNSFIKYFIEVKTSIIGDNAFRGYSSLKSITIPDSVTEIGYNAFNGCSSLTSIVIPKSVTEIGYNAFNGCSSLTSITIPKSVNKIGDAAFNGCSSLESITIPGRVTEVGMGAFNGCSSLTSITIPKSVTEIGYNAFNGCSSLKSVVIPSGLYDEVNDDKKEYGLDENVTLIKSSACQDKADRKDDPSKSTSHDDPPY